MKQKEINLGAKLKAGLAAGVAVLGMSGAFTTLSSLFTSTAAVACDVNADRSCEPPIDKPEPPIEQGGHVTESVDLYCYAIFDNFGVATFKYYIGRDDTRYDVDLGTRKLVETGYATKDQTFYHLLGAQDLSSRTLERLSGTAQWDISAVAGALKDRLSHLREGNTNTTIAAMGYKIGQIPAGTTHNELFSVCNQMNQTLLNTVPAKRMGDDGDAAKYTTPVLAKMPGYTMQG
ncbi:MAG TPA: hypothetical protein VIN59_08390 [Alphaproteobacteria bacterium]